MRTRVLLVTLLIASACRSAEKPVPAVAIPVDAAAAPIKAAALPPLRPLDASTAAAFRATFDELVAHPRYIVALSPT